MNPQITEYLTEQSLGEFLKKYLPNGNWVAQYKLPESRFRVDWFSDTLSTCVEFDGYQHYTSSKQILNDTRKDALCESLGLKMVRVPYFVQLLKETIDVLFGVKIDYIQSFPHGFIANKSTMVYPADFCCMGIERFVADLSKFACVRSDIVASLTHKDIDPRLLLPSFPIIRTIAKSSI